MEFGICKLSNVPLRAEASDKSELVSQVFFGECYQVLIRQGNWLHIKVLADNYEGWIDYKQHYAVTPDYATEWQTKIHPRALDIVQTVSSVNERIPILIGATLPFFDGINIRINDKKMFYNGRASNPSAPITQNFLIKIAKTFLKAPYVWGGKSVFGIDCSGFTQQVMGMCGFLLPRDAWQQVSQGQEVHFASQTQPGDLAFFDNDEGRIIHVGIMLEDQQIIHAHGEVRVDYLDHHGIYNLERKRYSHKLRIIKRIIPA